MRGRRFEYFRYMDTWVIVAPILCLLVGGLLLAAPAIFKFESAVKDIVIAVGGLLAGQITILLGEIPRAKERALERRELAISAVLVGVNVGTLSLIGDFQVTGKQPKFLARASAHFRRLGLSEEAFQTVVQSRVPPAQFLESAGFLIEYYASGIEEAHPALSPLYRAGLTSMAAGNLLFRLANAKPGSPEETELIELKHKVLRNLEQSIARLSESKEYSGPGHDILDPVLHLVRPRHASYEKLINYLEEL